MTTQPPFDLDRARYVSLATFRRDGSEVRTPVWIAPSGGRHYVFSAGNVGKVKRIRATPRVRLAECDIRGNVSSDWVEGRARILAGTAANTEALRALRAKYGWQMLMGDFFSKLSGRFNKRDYIEISV